MGKPNKQGWFDLNTLEVRFGGPLSKPHNVFTAKAIKIPDYTYQVKERESLGNGWYGNMETNTYTQDALYLIVKDNIVIGTMYNKYNQESKTELQEVKSNKVLDFIKSLNLEYKPI